MKQEPHPILINVTKNDAGRRYNPFGGCFNIVNTSRHIVYYKHNNKFGSGMSKVGGIVNDNGVTVTSEKKATNAKSRNESIEYDINYHNFNTIHNNKITSCHIRTKVHSIKSNTVTSLGNTLKVHINILNNDTNKIIPCPISITTNKFDSTLNTSGSSKITNHNNIKSYN